MTLFELPEPQHVPPGEYARTTTVREHERRVSLPVARCADPPTSQAAARGDRDGTLSLIRVAFRAARDGLTDDELCAQLQRQHSPTVKSARSRMSKAGLLVDSGRTRLSNCGRPLVVWKLGSPAVAGGHDRELESH